LVLEKKVLNEKTFFARFWVSVGGLVGGLVGVSGPFCDISKEPSHRSFILKMGLLSVIFHAIYQFLAYN
jgi:hypothetical protein